MIGHIQTGRIRFLMFLFISTFFLASCSREESAPREPAPKRPENVKIKKEKIRLVGYGVGKNSSAGRDVAMDNALGSLAQQASGVTFRYDKNSGSPKLTMKSEAYISKYKVEKEHKLGEQLIIVVSGDTEVERVENAKLIDLQKTISCKPEELAEKVKVAIADAASEVVLKELPGVETKEGWVYLTNFLLDVSADKSAVEVTLYLKVMFGV
jgi:hypothetical protein